jgi:hypothetical protein
MAKRYAPVDPNERAHQRYDNPEMVNPGYPRYPGAPIGSPQKGDGVILYESGGAKVREADMDLSKLKPNYRPGVEDPSLPRAK